MPHHRTIIHKIIYAYRYRYIVEDTTFITLLLYVNFKHSRYVKQSLRVSVTLHHVFNDPTALFRHIVSCTKCASYLGRPYNGHQLFTYYRQRIAIIYTDRLKALLLLMCVHKQQSKTLKLSCLNTLFTQPTTRIYTYYIVHLLTVQWTRPKAFALWALISACSIYLSPFISQLYGIYNIAFILCYVGKNYQQNIPFQTSFLRMLVTYLIRKFKNSN